MVENSNLRAIIWGVRLGDPPPSYEILFLAQLDDDHRVVRLPFQNPPQNETQAFTAARKELDHLPRQALIELARTAELLDRSALDRKS